MPHRHRPLDHDRLVGLEPHHDLLARGGAGPARPAGRRDGEEGAGGEGGLLLDGRAPLVGDLPGGDHVAEPPGGHQPEPGQVREEDRRPGEGVPGQGRWATSWIWAAVRSGSLARVWMEVTLPGMPMSSSTTTGMAVARHRRATASKPRAMTGRERAITTYR